MREKSDKRGTAKIYTRWRCISRESYFFDGKLIQNQFLNPGPPGPIPGKRPDGVNCLLCWRLIDLIFLTDHRRWGWKHPSSYIFRKPTHSRLQQPIYAIHVSFSRVFFSERPRCILFLKSTNSLVKGKYVTLKKKTTLFLCYIIAILSNKNW